jgi:uncharacterized protein
VTLVRMVVSLVVFSTLLGLGHYYLWYRLFRAPELPKAYRRWGAVLLGALAVALPLTFVVTRIFPPEQTGIFSFAAFLWMGVASTLACALVLVDFIRGLSHVWNRLRSAEAADQDRRLFFKRLVAGGVAVMGSGVAAVSVREALSEVQVKRVEVTLQRLAAEFDGFRIVQISDVHIGPTLGREFLTGVVDRINELKPNLVAITGDLVDGSVAHLAQHTEPLGTLRSSDGVYFVTGNHEYYSGADDWIRELDRLGIPTLRNRRVSLQRGSAYLDLAGVTDHRADSFGDAPDYELALGGREEGREVILLAHQPAAATRAAEFGVGLQLSGHTHGGQFWPWTWVIYLIQPVVRGLGRIGKTQVYVNTGTGYWGPPLRFRTPPEITEITLRVPA